MRSHSIFIIRIALLFLATLGLAFAADQATNIPSPNSVASISVSQRKDASFVRITDRATIEKTLATLLANNHGWEKSLVTFPTPQANAMFNKDKGETVFVLSFGPNWIGAAVEIDGKIEPRFWRGSPKIERSIRQLLGINT